MLRLTRPSTALALSLAWSLALTASATGRAEQAVSVVAPTVFSRACVASESAIASRAGLLMLERGGNAIDAAVATAFALAVVHPTAGNLGGGGFLVMRTPGGEATTFDFRETAPLAATPQMFLGPDGKYDAGRHHWSILAVGVPGSVAGLHLAHQRLGRLPWKDLLQPAIDLAQRGFVVSRGLAESLGEVMASLRKHPASLAQFTRDGTPLKPGEPLIQRDLARTLERIRDQGPAGFYEGETADLLVKEMERQGGLIRHEDLKRYRAVERPPVRGTYRGRELIGMGPPSSGGIAIIEMLNILEGFDPPRPGLRGVRETHLLVEAMRRAFADRARFLGDPDFGEIPAARLLSKEHAAELRRTFRLDRASKSSPDAFEWPREGSETTHLSVVDADLMAVALTTTLEQSYGSRIVVPGAGFLLNNEMGDFNAQPGVTTAGGLIGTAANLAAPGKRMLSSMSPTIVVEGGRPVLVLGSPGGRTIINSVALVALNVLDHRLAIQDAVDAPRFHHQWLPDRLRAEPLCFTPEALGALEALGHQVDVTSEPQGSVQAISILYGADGKPARLEAGVDRRRADGGAAGF